MSAKNLESDKANGHANGPSEAVLPDAMTGHEPAEETIGEEGSDIVGKVAVAGVIGVGAALIEASLIPGLIIGAAAVLAPKYIPEVGSRLRPLFKSTIRGAYKLTEKTREAFAEAQEQVQDIMAEARHEKEEQAAAAMKPASEMPAKV